MTESRGAQSLISEADRCVKCGLCLPACPTYDLTRSESDSPRGRIALIDALARSNLPDDNQLLAHLDSCLLCHSCEKSCPSGVHFGQLMDQARALTFAHRPVKLRWLAGLFSKRSVARFGILLSRLIPDALLPAPEGLLAAARRLAGRRLPYKPLATPADAPTVALFRGCVGDAVQASALTAAKRLLNAAGIHVETPAGQACCGAMHEHLGNIEQAGKLAERNRRAFAIDQLDAVLSLASGCGAQLAKYQPTLAAPHRDISDYLVSSGCLDQLTFRPLPAQALVHIPCSHKNQLGSEQAVVALLSRIPELQVCQLTAGSNCCGAAGLSLVSHPEQGQALREPKLAAIRDAQPDFLVTSNPGCALHLAAGLGIESPEVHHPVELVARQLDQGQ